MVEAGVSAVLSKLGEVAATEATSLLKVDDQIRTLRNRLGYLQAVVRGADQQRRGRASELLLVWVREAREVAFDVEDAVDEFHLKVETFQVTLHWSRAWHRSVVKLLYGLPMQIVARHALSRDITKINERIKEIEQIKETYSIKSEASEISSASFIDTDATWDIADVNVELRTEEFKALKKSILGMSSPRSVISIIGDSGAGKTRLARKLFNDGEVQDKFEELAWICLPPRMRFDKYVDMIYDKICPSAGRKEEKQISPAAGRPSGESSRKLKALLGEKKYLVVLDGVVDMSHWNCLLDLLPRGKVGSIVLVTSSELTAREIKLGDKGMKPTVLGALTEEQTASLFGGLPLYARMSELGATDFHERVHSISGGLPLAAVVLGGILRAKDDPQEWIDLVYEKLWTAAGRPQPLRCLFSVAFEELPHHLKSCFLHLATSAENMRLDPQRLVRLWVAEGFVSPHKGRTLEEVGLGYLKELVLRGLLEVVAKDARGRIAAVAVHGLLHSFAEAEAEESSFVEVHHHASVLNPRAVRRLALHNFVDRYVDLPDKFPKLRSLFCDFLEDDDAPAPAAPARCRCCLLPSPSPKLHQLRLLGGSRFLRVIELRSLRLARLPAEIGSIIHLRYLGIRNCALLQELPKSIARLANLQTLDVRETQVAAVTHGFWGIAALRHVLADTLELPSARPTIQLKNLQTLVGALVPPPGPSALDHMLYLRTLALSGVAREHVPALSSSLHKMDFLLSLSLSGDQLPCSVFSSPSSRLLEALALHGPLDGCPAAPFILPNLGSLTMSKSGNLTQHFVDEVSALPNLAEMELLEGSYVDAEMLIRKDDVDGRFPSLAKLTLAEMEEGSAYNKFARLPVGDKKMLVINYCATSAGSPDLPNNAACVIMQSCDQQVAPSPLGYDQPNGSMPPLPSLPLPVSSRISVRPKGTLVCMEKELGNPPIPIARQATI